MRILPIIFSIFVAACNGNSANDSSPPPTDAGTIAIYDVQGSGAASPLDGQAVIVAGIVSGDFQEKDDDDRRNLGGFYLQDETPDANTATSDGVFVFDGNTPAVDINVGDRVVVEGTVNEYFGETQVNASLVTVGGSGAIQPVSIDLPAAATVANSDGLLIADLERYEGMLVRFPQILTVSGLSDLDRYGEVHLAQGGRLIQYTNHELPDVDGYEMHRKNVAARTLLLDDGRRRFNVTPIQYLPTDSTSVDSIRVGDQLKNLTGALRFARGSGPNGTESYRLMPTIEPTFDTQNPRPMAPQLDGAFRVASFNTLNFFSTIDSGERTCGPAADDGCRGADSDAELQRQLIKLVTALDLIDADIVGLIEIENNAGVALQAIVDRLNSVSDHSYGYVDTGLIGRDVITTGFMYKTDTASVNGAPAILDASVDARFNSGRNRPAIAQSFTQMSNDAVVSVVINHLKSKGSACDSDGDPNLGDGQGNCNATRNDAAAALADWVATDPTDSGDTDYLVVGDFNAYLFEDPIATLKRAGLVNVSESSGGGADYSFVFDAQSGALDHAFASASLVPQVADALVWHINADEPIVLDYNLDSGRDPALFDATTPYRASDHDPLIIGLDLID